MIGDRWGVTDDEVARRFGCDDFVDAPALQAWRGVTVRARPEDVWPWIRQLRLAPYSYDWIDNLGRRSPGVLADLADPEPGEPFTSSGSRRVGRVVAVEPGRQLTARILGSYMSYLVEPREGGSRLLLKIVMARGRWVAPLVSVGDLVMARQQLLNLKRLAESAS